MSGVLTIVGASARAAAGSAVRGGYSVHAGDMFADVDLRGICQATSVTNYPAGLADVVGGPQPGGWIYTGGLENEPALIDRLAGQRPLWGNSAAVVRMVRDPKKLHSILRNAGCLFPEVAFRASEVPRDGTWLRKPRRSAGGSRIARWDRTACDDTSSSTRHDYFQQYIAGTPCSAVYVAADGQSRSLGLTEQLVGQSWCGADGFRYCGSIGPLVVRPEWAESFARIGELLARSCQLTGLFGVDAVVNAEGVWPVEVNPRYPASAELFDWAYDISVVKLHVEACESGQLPPPTMPERRHCCGKAVVYATRRFVVSDQLCELLTEPRAEAWPSLADIPEPGSTIEPGWPIVSVLAAAETETQVLERLHTLAAQILAAACD